MFLLMLTAQVDFLQTQCDPILHASILVAAILFSGLCVLQLQLQLQLQATKRVVILDSDFLVLLKSFQKQKFYHY